MSTNDTGQRPPRPQGPQDETEIRRLERRVEKLEYELADFKQQHTWDLNNVKQIVESKERVVLELHQRIDELKRTVNQK